MANQRTVINDRWQRENTRRIVCKFFLKSDADVISQLDKQDNRTDYIRRLIRADIARQDEPTETE